MCLGGSSGLRSWLRHFASSQPEAGVGTSQKFSFLICKMGTIIPILEVVPRLEDAWQTVGSSALVSTLPPKTYLSQIIGRLQDK